MLFLNINSNLGATSKHKSCANDILRNEFAPSVTYRGGSASTQKKLQLYEEQCLKPTQGASAKTQANRHLVSSSYSTSGARAVTQGNKKKTTLSTNKKQSMNGAGNKASGQKQKSSLKPEGSFLKGKGKYNKEYGGPEAKKQTRFEADVGSESD